MDAEYIPAKLFRIDGEPGTTIGRHGAVEEGDLRDMIRIAISDNKGELWRYSIVSEGKPLITAAQIDDMAKRMGIEPE